MVLDVETQIKEELVVAQENMVENFVKSVCKFPLFLFPLDKYVLIILRWAKNDWLSNCFNWT